MSREWLGRAKELYRQGYTYSDINEVISIKNNTIAKAFMDIARAERKEMELEHIENREKPLEIVHKPIEKEGKVERKPKLIDKGDYYMIVSPSVSVSITKDQLRKLKKGYCGKKLTVNQMLLEMNLTRPEFFAIKTAFGITKDDVPYIDEDLDDPEALANETIIDKKRAYFAALISKELKSNEKELKMYREKEYWLDKTLLACENIKAEPMDYDEPLHRESNNEGQLNLADWHIGMNCDNYWNTYNYAIAQARIKELTRKAIWDFELYNVNTVHVMNLGDIIHGLIHTSTRVEAEFNVQEQVTKAVNLLAGILHSLAEKFETVYFYNTYGNHSRFTSNKRDALDTENFELFIPTFLKGLLCNCPNVIFKANEIDEQWIVADICGHTIIGTHGDRDKIKKAPSNMTMMYKKPYKIFIGHQHHVEGWTQHSVEIKMIGCLCGVETHAKDLRLTSQPSQSLCIYNKKGLIHSHDIELGGSK